MFATHQLYSRGQGSALPLQSVAFFFQIGMKIVGSDKLLKSQIHNTFS
ncbi:hypothetical protein NIES2107_47280 [Nostoc carneum NIES-2107]|nr:hypothetical protein NIES2107_47280 [Nostoc carneum NIES-2107]